MLFNLWRQVASVASDCGDLIYQFLQHKQVDSSAVPTQNTQGRLLPTAAILSAPSPAHNCDCSYMCVAKYPPLRNYRAGA